MGDAGAAVPTALDSNWLRAHPLPEPAVDADKNTRGRVFIVGGCATVPGGLLLTAQAALRAGAGKVQVAPPAKIALALGMALPEIAVYPVETGPDGEITCLDAMHEEQLDHSDAIVVGPAMASGEAAGRVVDWLLTRADDATLVLDAAALMTLRERADALARRRRPAILTPHIGEMAALLACNAATIEQDRPGAVRRAADRFGAVIALKGATSLIADREGGLFAYAGGGVGLATGGSGDVLAGIAAGLAARGACALDAANWAVWLHGEAGRRCAQDIGSIGFLARELLGYIPGLMQTI